MSGKRSKRHHFVPKVLQKPFANQNDHLWFVTRRPDGRFGEIEDRNIASAFWQKDRYTTFDANRMLTDVVERTFYGRIDDYLGQIIPDVLKAFERREVPNFEGKPLKSIRNVAYELIKRTPDFTNNYDDLEIGRDFISKVVPDLCSAGETEKADTFRSYLDDEALLARYGRSIRVRGMTRGSKTIKAAMNDMSVRWATIEGRPSFVLSSLIAYRFGNGGSNGLSNPDMEIWMPVSPKHALVLLRDPEGKIPLRMTETDQHVRFVNEFAIQNSLCAASRSRRLLESLARVGGIL